MRYEPIDKISFTNAQNKTVSIRDMREYPAYQTFVTLNIQSQDEIDEIATRQDIYGNESEGESYKIVDNNIEQIFEEGFSLERITKLRIPL